LLFSALEERSIVNETKSTLGRIIEFTSERKGKMTVSVILGIIGVICGMFPYYSIIKIVSALYGKTADVGMILKYIGFAFAGEVLKYLLSTKSMMMAHDSAYTILETIRKQLSEKMMGVPLGSVSDTPSGKIKSMIVGILQNTQSYGRLHCLRICAM